MNVEKSKEVYYNVRVEKEIDGKDCYDSVSMGREDLARIIAKALKENGFKVNLTRFTQKKTERITWKDLKI
jgi:flavorubredoxin